MRLHIDTRERSNIIVAFYDERGKLLCSVKSAGKKVNPESALTFVKKGLEKIGKDVAEVDEILVERGPGSYTGTRVGVSIANALSFSLGVPINKRSIAAIETPYYD